VGQQRVEPLLGAAAAAGPEQGQAGDQGVNVLAGLQLSHGGRLLGSR